MTINTMDHFHNECARLWDDEVPLRFNELAGTVNLIDGVAASGAWLLFKFVDGPFTGRTIACAEASFGSAPPAFCYEVHVSDDGFLFNRDPTRPAKHDDTVEGGECYPEWDGLILTFKVDLTQP